MNVIAFWPNEKYPLEEFTASNCFLLSLSTISPLFIASNVSFVGVNENVNSPIFIWRPSNIFCPLIVPDTEIGL